MTFVAGAVAGQLPLEDGERQKFGVSFGSNWLKLHQAASSLRHWEILGNIGKYVS